MNHRGHHAEFWQERALEAEAWAAEMRDDYARKLMRRIAMMYDAMALRVAVQEIEGEVALAEP